MKKILLIGACCVFVGPFVYTSCKKDSGVSAELNKAPTAKAGTDITIRFDFCLSRVATADLDGSGSSDPDNNITSYKWTKISGPGGIVIRNPTSAKTLVEKILPGKYAFELTVSDEYGLISRDTSIISAGGPEVEYDLDITTNTVYNFVDNFEDCYYGCTVYDYTSILGTATSSQAGVLRLNVSEYADTANVSDTHDTYMSLNMDAPTNKYVGGTSTINFKKIIRDGGGPFTGTLTLGSGTAQACEDLLKNLSPLNVTGSLDTANKTVTITIKGKALF